MENIDETDTGAQPGASRTLVEKAGSFSMILAIIVFLLNMMAAWWITAESTRVIGRPLVSDHPTAVSMAINAAPAASANNHVLLNRLLNTELMMRAAQNRHTITVVALSVAFALVAIGFALFVMGAEGAFRLQGKVSDRGDLMVKATAPGLLCFVLAVIIVCFALFTKTELEPGEFSVYPDPAIAANSVGGDDMNVLSVGGTLVKQGGARVTALEAPAETQQIDDLVPLPEDDDLAAEKGAAATQVDSKGDTR